MKLFLEFLAKPLYIKWLLVRAMYYSLYYKRLIQKIPFAEYAKKIGVFGYETPKEPIGSQRISDVKWVVYAVRRWAPWKSLCFDCALLAKRILNDAHLPCTLYMGVKRNCKGELVAHAWLRCGSVFVSGGNGVGYAVTGIYGDKK